MADTPRRPDVGIAAFARAQAAAKSWIARPRLMVIAAVAMLGDMTYVAVSPLRGIDLAISAVLFITAVWAGTFGMLARPGKTGIIVASVVTLWVTAVTASWLSELGFA